MNGWDKIHSVKPSSGSVLLQNRTELRMSKYSSHHRRSKVNYIPMETKPATTTRLTVSAIENLFATRQNDEVRTNNKVSSAMQPTDNSNSQVQPLPPPSITLIEHKV